MLPTEQQIRSILRGPVKKSGTHLICNCWNCGKEGKYYYNLKNGLSDCKKCSLGFNLFQFLQGWDALWLIEGNQININNDVALIKPLIDAEVAAIKTLPDSRLPAGFKRLQYGEQNLYAKYLRDRKYTETDFQIYGPGYTNLLNKYDGYVIIPMYDGWHVKGFLARNVCSDEEARYKNQKGVEFGHLLDGIDECTNATTTAILVEGHFDKIGITNELGLHHQDAIKVLQSFGKKLSDVQIEKILHTNINTLFVWYDMSDAIDQIKQFGNLLKRKIEVFG